MRSLFSKQQNNSLSQSERDELQALREENKKLTLAFDEVRHVSDRVAKGELSARVINWDEYGDLSTTLSNLNKSYDLVDAFIRESTASLEAANNKEYHRTFMTQGILGDFGRAADSINKTAQSMQESDVLHKTQLNELADQFESQVLEIIGSLSVSSQKANENANQVISNADETKQMATSVAAAAEEATTNVATVAAAAQQLSASVGEIEKQVSASTLNTKEAASNAETTSGTISELSKASETIGNVVKLIGDIANQTNMLALNATIESARAGEAGRGFAVVATEVKALAQQTTDATNGIAAQISEIQSKTNESVSAVGSIRDGIEELNAISKAIAGAIAEQTAAMLDMSRNITEASQGASDVSMHINNVSTNTNITLSLAQELVTASDEVETQTNLLKEQSEGFVLSIRKMGNS